MPLSCSLPCACSVLFAKCPRSAAREYETLQDRPRARTSAISARAHRVLPGTTRTRTRGARTCTGTRRLRLRTRARARIVASSPVLALRASMTTRSTRLGAPPWRLLPIRGRSSSRCAHTRARGSAPLPSSTRARARIAVSTVSLVLVRARGRGHWSPALAGFDSSASVHLREHGDALASLARYMGTARPMYATASTGLGGGASAQGEHGQQGRAPLRSPRWDERMRGRRVGRRVEVSSSCAV
ncbi:hypothetical protein DFH09DRAFT_1371679 [Mycena vulgaris]|nr:hypothetical protein DFH09DRAFT_1371679 [Mycena vulgaris]